MKIKKSRLPYKVRDAVAKGYTPVRIKQQPTLDWCNIINFIKRNITKHVVYESDSQGGGWVAFQTEAQASFAVLKFS